MRLKKMKILNNENDLVKLDKLTVKNIENNDSYKKFLGKYRYHQKCMIPNLRKFLRKQMTS